MGLINVIKPLLSTALSSRLINYPQQHQEFRKILGNARNQTRGCWVRSENSIHCAMPHPTLPSSLVSYIRYARVVVGLVYFVVGHLPRLNCSNIFSFTAQRLFSYWEGFSPKLSKDDNFISKDSPFQSSLLESP